MIFKKVFRVGLSLVVGFSMLSTPFVSDTVLSKIGLERIDVISHATGRGGGGMIGGFTPIDPEEREEGRTQPITEEDKALPYENDFIESMEYDNAYGFIRLVVNSDYLQGGYVDQIEFIGIGDKKYRYSGVNQDKADTYNISIPYKYFEPGFNDVYFYMEEDTYKVGLELTEGFVKEKPAPKLIALENVGGTGVAFELKLVHNSDEDRTAFYTAFRDNIGDKISLLELLNPKNPGKPVDTGKYQVSLNEDEDKLIIQLDEGMTIYDNIYAYRVIFESEGYTKSSDDVVIFKKHPELTQEWLTATDNSLKLSTKDGKINFYFKELKEVELIKLDAEDRAIASVLLTRDEDYSATHYDMVIKSKVFESNTKYRLRLKKKETKTAELDIQSPELEAVKPAYEFFVDDIEKKTNFNLSFNEEHGTWIENWTELRLIGQYGYDHVLRDIINKEKDDEENGYVENGYGKKKNPNIYYSFDQDSKTLILDSKYFDRSMRWTLVFKARGYEDTMLSFFVKDSSSYYDSAKPIELVAEILEGADYSLDIKAKNEKDKIKSLLWIYRERISKKPVGPSIVLFDLTDKTHKTLEMGEDKDYWGSSKDSYYIVNIKAKNFKSGHRYRAVLTVKDSPSSAVEFSVPEMPELKQAAIEVADIILGNNIVIKSDKDFIENVSSVFLEDERGSNLTLTGASLTKDGDSLSLAYDASVGSKFIKEKEGEFYIEVLSKGYDKASAHFVVKKTGIKAESKVDEKKNQVELSFLKGKWWDSDFIKSVTVLELNGRPLSKTMYRRGSSAIYLADRLLKQGDNHILVKSRLYTDVELTFSYENNKLGEEKAELLKQVEESKLSKARKAELLSGIEKAETLRELRSIKIDVRAAVLGLPKLKKQLKEDYTKQIDESELGAELKKALKDQLEKIEDIDELKAFEARIEAELEKLIEQKELEERLKEEAQRRADQREDASYEYREYPADAPDGKADRTLDIEKDQTPKSALTQEELPFKDLKDLKDSKVLASIAYLFERGIMKGTAADSFSPELKLNRASIVMLLHNIAKQKPTVHHNFEDVKPGIWYEEALSWAREHKIVQGRGANKFQPAQLINRQEFALVLHNFIKYRALELTPSSNVEKYADFKDVAPWAKEAMVLAVDLGFFDCLGAEEDLAPKSHITRAEAALFFHHFMEKILNEN